MSSFIISKREFIKCAGAVAAISDLCDKQLVKEVFAMAYEANVKSVNLQYNEDTPIDTNEYNALFEDQYAFAKVCGDRQRLMQYVLSFMASVMYQIEDDYCASMTGESFIRLMRDMSAVDSRCWGRFTFKEDTLKEAFCE